MKKILTVSLFAMMAVTAANAEIASTKYVDDQITADAVNTVETGATNGTIKVDNTEVAVKGLGSAAYTNSDAYDAAGTAQTLISGLSNGAISELTTTVQGLETSVETLSSTKANAADVYTKTQIDNTVNTLATKTELDDVSAVADAAQTESEVKALIQSDAVNTVETGATNGTIKVDNTEVAVKGLGSAAYTNSDAYATAAQGLLAESAMQESELKKLQSYTTNGCATAGVMCSLVSVGGTITWEKVNQGSGN